jgi:hypothetical protein
MPYTSVVGAGSAGGEIDEVVAVAGPELLVRAELGGAVRA